MIVTLASLASERLGQAEEAQDLLEKAERKIPRARLNGVDDPGIYYSEAVLMTMRNDSEKGLEKLQEAYNRGWREHWVLEIDRRLDPLRDQADFLLLKDQVKDDISKALAEIRSLPIAFL
jgi:hypothetical protein